MDYERASALYLGLRDEVEELERGYKTLVAARREKMALLEGWFTAKAQADGLENIKTAVGTCYWSNPVSATVANPTLFMDYVIQFAQWQLLENRVSKSAAKEFVTATGMPPPGVNYRVVRTFNLRAKKEKSDE